MAKLQGMYDPVIHAAFHGVADFYCHKRYGWIVRAWPKPHRPCETPAWLATVDNMRKGWARAKLATEDDKTAVATLVENAGKTTIDLIRSSAMSAPAGQILFLFPDAIQFTPQGDGTTLFEVKKPDYVNGSAEDDTHTYTVVSSAVPGGKKPRPAPGPPVECPKRQPPPRRRLQFPANVDRTPITNTHGSPWMSAYVPCDAATGYTDACITATDKHGRMRPITGDIEPPLIPPWTSGWYCMQWQTCWNADCSICGPKDPPICTYYATEAAWASELVCGYPGQVFPPFWIAESLSGPYASQAACLASCSAP